MKPSLRKFLISFFITGLLFASAMAAFDHFDNKPFDLLRFIFRFVLFGLGMTLISTFMNKNKKTTE